MACDRLGRLLSRVDQLWVKAGKDTGCNFHRIVEDLAGAQRSNKQIRLPVNIHQRIDREF
ncbi:hypothetical protein [Alkaliphilus crotonatoxidans]